MTKTDQSKHNLILVSIVGLVAIIAISLIFTTNSSETQESISGDLTGQAIKTQMIEQKTQESNIFNVDELELKTNGMCFNDPSKGQVIFCYQGDCIKVKGDLCTGNGWWWNTGWKIE